MNHMLMCLMGLALSVSGCDVVSALPTRAESESSALSVPPQAAEVGDELEAQLPTATQPTPEADDPDTTFSLAEMEEQVRADLAAVLGAPIDQIRVTEADESMWEDEGLGCNARRGVFEMARVPGYRLVLAYGADTFEYHADQHGHFVRCIDQGRPLAPIVKPLEPIIKPLYPIIKSER